MKSWCDLMLRTRDKEYANKFMASIRAGEPVVFDGLEYFVRGSNAISDYNGWMYVFELSRKQ